MVPRAGIEPATQGFSVLRSTTELPRLDGRYITQERAIVQDPGLTEKNTG